MSGNLIVIIGILIYYLVMYIFGVINKLNMEKKFLVPNRYYFANIFKGVSIFQNAVKGIAVPAEWTDRSDKYYYQPTKKQFMEARNFAGDMMLEEGWKVEDYQRRAKDCEDFAMKMCIEIRNYIATKWTDEVGAKGIAVGFSGYTRDKDGAGHMINHVLFKGDKFNTYFEPYAELRFRNELVLSDNEKNSISLNFM